MDIKQKIKEIDARIELAVEALGEDATEHQLQVLADAKVRARQQLIVGHLNQLEAAGAECPTLVDVVDWMGDVDPEIRRFADLLDRMTDEEALVAMHLLFTAQEIGDTQGEQAAIDFINRVVDEAVAATEIDQINVELSEAAAEDNAARQVDPAVQAVYSEASNVESDAASRDPHDVMEEVVNFLIERFPDTIRVDQSYDNGGTAININVFIPR